ncbi:MAG: CoA transferase [Chloroflexi bacterium]|nr:CoA transferase [Chloroflexota bacterium]
MTQQDGLLSDIKVLDLSEGISGPLCGKLFAGMGAEVIKIELPDSGDESRSAGPFPNDDPNPETSAVYLYLNMGKKGITLDIETDTGASILRRLARESDILIESHPPGFMESRTLGYADLEPLNPGLVYTSITPFGQTGPYRDYKGGDLVIQAVGALMHTIGLPDKEPIKVGGNVALHSVGMSAFSGTMIALYVRDVQGYGQHVDVSAMQTVTVTQIHASIHHQFGRIPTRRESTLVEAADGWVNPGLEIGVQEDTWKKVCDLMGLPELADNLPEGVYVIGLHVAHAHLDEFFKSAWVGRTVRRRRHRIELSNHKPILPPEDIKVPLAEFIQLVLEIPFITIY